MNKLGYADTSPHKGNLRAGQGAPLLNHVTRNSGGQWLAALVICLAVFAFFMWYHAVRGRPYSLFVANKCIGIASVFSIGLALALGPVARRWPKARRLLPYRRTLGVAGAVLAFPHVVGSLFFFPEQFPLNWYLKNWVATTSGLVGFLLLSMIAAHSNPWGLGRFGRERWLGLQRYSWLAFALVLGHLLLQNKFPNWIQWLQTFDKPFPPGAFTTSLFCLAVLGLKGWEMLRNAPR